MLNISCLPVEYCCRSSSLEIDLHRRPRLDISLPIGHRRWPLCKSDRKSDYPRRPANQGGSLRFRQNLHKGYRGHPVLCSGRIETPSNFPKLVLVCSTTIHRTSNNLSGKCRHYYRNSAKQREYCLWSLIRWKRVWHHNQCG